MKKKIIFSILFMLINIGTIYAKEEKNISFDENIFNTYFEEQGYKLDEYECLGVKEEYSSDCVIFSALNTETKEQVELYKFSNKDYAYSYFKYVYEDNYNYLTDISVYNIDRELDSNYSYFDGILFDYHYLYLVNIDNYVIKSNIDKDDFSTLVDIYKDLGIEKESNINIYLVIGIIIVVLIILGFIIGKIIKKKKIEKQVV